MKYQNNAELTDCMYVSYEIHFMLVKSVGLQLGFIVKKEVPTLYSRYFLPEFIMLDFSLC